jgi:WD40 repeat protein
MKKKMVLAVCCILFAVWAGYADTTIVIHPNGKEIISSCFEEIHIWDMESGSKVQTFGSDYEIPGYKIMAMAISPDGRRLVARYNGGIVMWDMEHFTACWSIEDGHAWHGVFSFSPDGTKLAYYSIADSEDGGTADGIPGSIVILDVESGNEIMTVAKDLRTIYSLAYGPDGKMLIGALNDTIKIWDAQNGKETGILTGHGDTVNSVSYSPDGKMIISASADKTVKIWNTETRQEIITLSGHTKAVITASFSSDGLLAVSSGGSYGEPINLWNVKTGDKVLSLPGEWRWYEYAAFIHDNTRIVSHSGNITIWDANTGSEIKEIKIPGDNES